MSHLPTLIADLALILISVTQPAFHGHRIRYSGSGGFDCHFNDGTSFYNGSKSGLCG